MIGLECENTNPMCEDIFLVVHYAVAKKSQFILLKADEIHCLVRVAEQSGTFMSGLLV